MTLSIASKIVAKAKFVPVLVVTFLLTSCIETVPFVDVNRYLGTWYEIANYPSQFSQGLVGTKATYGLNEDGSISILNEAFAGSCQGEPTSITGFGTPDDETNSKLSIKLEVAPGFFNDGKYWVIGLDEEYYNWAVVSDPTMQSLFILNREPTMDPDLYNDIVDMLIEVGYDEYRIQLTEQCV